MTKNINKNIITLWDNNQLSNPLQSNGLDLKPNSWADTSGCKYRQRIPHRSGLRGRCWPAGGNAVIAGRSCPRRPPDKLDKDKDSASQGTTYNPVDSPGGSREPTWWTRSSTPGRWFCMMEEVRPRYWDHQRVLLPPWEEYLEVHHIH